MIPLFSPTDSCQTALFQKYYSHALALISLKMGSWPMQSFTEKSEVGIWQTATHIHICTNQPNNQLTVWDDS